MAQLVEWLLPIPEVCGSNPVISKNLLMSNICILCIEKTKIKKKRPGMANFFFKKKQYVSSLVDLLPIVAVGSTVIVLDFRRIRTQIFRVKGNYFIIAS